MRLSAGLKQRAHKVQEDTTPAGMPEDEPPAVRHVPLGIVIARILVVSGLGFAAALAIFFLVGGLWLPGLVSVVATVVFLALMFAIEHGAQGRAE